MTTLHRLLAWLKQRSEYRTLYETWPHGQPDKWPTSVKECPVPHLKGTKT